MDDTRAEVAHGVFGWRTISLMAASVPSA